MKIYRKVKYRTTYHVNGHDHAVFRQILYSRKYFTTILTRNRNINSRRPLKQNWNFYSMGNSKRLLVNSWKNLLYQEDQVYENQ